MSKKHNTIATPESRHLVAAEKEFADGWVKYALWNTVIDGPDEVSEANKSRYLQLRAERLAIEEAKAATAVEGVEVVPYEVIQGRFGGPKLMSELPSPEPKRFPRPYFVFTTKRLIVLSRDMTPDTSPLPSPTLEYQDEIEQFWERTRAPITPNNNSITIRAIDAAVGTGAAISICFDEMRLAAKKQQLSRLDRLICADPTLHLDFHGKFTCGSVTRETSLSIKPTEPFNEIERVLRLLPIELVQ
jgi:hypothetical protein